MRTLLSLALISLCFSLTAQETINYPYNPDGNADGNITVPDLADFLVNYGNTFTPTEIQIDGVGLAEVIGQLVDNQNLLQATVEAQQAYITQLQQYISISEETVLISGANLQVVNGQGSTLENVNGTGNIIIGYDEEDLSGNADKSGSHNLVVGYGHTYSSFGGIVVGYNNSITGHFSSVSGGQYNTASGTTSSVSGGTYNNASGEVSSVSGGYGNSASGFYSSLSGGYLNTASGGYSSVSGGASNTASGDRSSVSGGYGNTASGYNSTVSGDAGNTFLDSSADWNTID